MLGQGPYPVTQKRLIFRTRIFVFNSKTTKSALLHFVAREPLRKLNFSISANRPQTASIVSMETTPVANNLTSNQEIWSEKSILNKRHRHSGVKMVLRRVSSLLLLSKIFSVQVRRRKKKNTFVAVQPPELNFQSRVSGTGAHD